MENIFGYGDYSALPNFLAIYCAYFNVSKSLSVIYTFVVPENLYDTVYFFKEYIMYQRFFMIYIHFLLLNTPVKYHI
jgi:hypothetical protein